MLCIYDKAIYERIIPAASCVALLIHSAIARGHKIDDCFTLWDALRKMRDIQQVEGVGGCELTGDQSRDGFTH
ncbi:Uncharacterized protein HZ326_2005 [Fusarium oxysporum f. sp. albedinis]|nr:Uncharacterized protein HZ326_2005 [Fusarium oxysporum f. sp. albedinis]